MATVLEAMEQRERAATPGPWEIPEGDLNGHIWAVGPIAGYEYDALEISYANAVFVSHSRADIPLLLAVARAATNVEKWHTAVQAQIRNGLQGEQQDAAEISYANSAWSDAMDNLHTVLSPLMEEAAE